MENTEVDIVVRAAVVAAEQETAYTVHNRDTIQRQEILEACIKNTDENRIQLQLGRIQSKGVICVGS